MQSGKGNGLDSKVTKRREGDPHKGDGNERKGSSKSI